MEQRPTIVRAAGAPKVRMTGDRGDSLRLIDEHSEVESVNVRFNRLETDAPGRRHRHPGSDLLCYVVTGRLELETPPNVVVLEPGDLAFIPAGVEHAIRNLGGTTLNFLEVYVPGRPDFVYS